MRLYDFEYRFLPSLVDAYNNKNVTINALLDINGWKRFLCEIGLSPNFPFSDISLTGQTFRNGDKCLLITFPEPDFSPLARYGAFHIDDKGAITYYTLEMGESLGDWFLGGMSDSVHHNYGLIGSCNNITEFASALQDYVLSKYLPRLNEFSSLAYRFIKGAEEFMERPGGFNDITPVLAPLSSLSVKEGYVLDAFDCGDYENYFFKPYFCLDGSETEYNFEMVDGNVVTPFDDTMYIQDTHPESICECLPSVETYVKCDFTRKAIWEAYLMSNLEHFFKATGSKTGHTWNMIFSKDFVPAAAREQVRQYSPYYLMVPSIRMFGTTGALITCPYWTAEDGVFVERVTVSKTEDGLRFDRRSIRTLTGTRN